MKPHQLAAQPNNRQANANPGPADKTQTANSSNGMPDRFHRDHCSRAQPGSHAARSGVRYSVIVPPSCCARRAATVRPARSAFSG